SQIYKYASSRLRDLHRRLTLHVDRARYTAPSDSDHRPPPEFAHDRERSMAGKRPGLRARLRGDLDATGNRRVGTVADRSAPQRERTVYGAARPVLRVQRGRYRPGREWPGRP